MFDIAVVGSGPGGCAASIYGGRAGVKICLITGPVPGGVMTTTNSVENYPGFKDITGTELMEKMLDQAVHSGAELMTCSVEKIEKNQEGFVLTTGENKKIISKTVILATGAVNKKLNIESEKTFENRGVSYCPICDGSLFKNETVAVIGGGNSATEAVLYLSKIVKKVYLIHRGDKLRSEKILQDRMFSLPNLEIIWNSSVVEFLGDNSGLKTITIVNKNKEQKNLDVTGVFISIGYTPNSKLAIGLAEIDSEGYVVSTQTRGFYVAGDLKNNSHKQAIVAAASGCETALSALEYLQQI